MKITVNDVLEFVEENDVKFIRLGFCDPLGIQKNISIMPERLKSAFEEGVSFDASAIDGFRGVKKSDLLLFPNPETMSVLPWRPGPGRVVRFYCDIKRSDGTVFLNDGRNILKNALKKASDMGYTCKIGAECEFYIFKTDENGDPTFNTLDNGSYLDISPIDKGENMRREICLCLEEMGIYPECSHHEQGPGQNEIDFEFSEALTCADNIMTFKSVVKSIVARNGFFASFMPKPLLNQAGNGMHINISLEKNGKNIFASQSSGNAKICDYFIAGILEKIREISVFLNPTINSYERLGNHKAPKYISWSTENRSQLVRIPADSKSRKRIEVRSPDTSVNPYYAFAVLIFAGLYGIENELELPEKIHADLFSAEEDLVSSLQTLPENLTEAIEIAKESQLLKELIGEQFLANYLALKEQEVTDYNNCSDKNEFYTNKYFNRI